MSHFTRLKTKMVERQYLIQALSDLGYNPDLSGTKVKGYAGNRAIAELKIDSGNPGFEIGFRKTKEVYEVIADWWGIQNLDQANFIDSLSQRYAYNASLAKLQEQGFNLVQEQTGQDGQIHLVLRRMSF